MPNVKWQQLPPRRGPNPQGLKLTKEKKNDRNPKKM